MKVKRLGELDDLSVIELPVGVSWAPKGKQQEEQFSRTAIIDRILGVDEENMNDKKLKGNQAAALTKLLQRVILELPPIWKGKSPFDLAPRNLILTLAQPDRDMIALQANLLSFGQFADLPWACPKGGCDGEGTIEEFDLGDIEVMYLEEGEDGDIAFVLIDGVADKEGAIHTEGSIRLATGLEQELIMKQYSGNQGKATTALLTSCIRNIGAIENISTTEVSRMTARDRAKIGGLIAENLPGPRLRFKQECPECDHEWEAPIVATNFSAGSRQ